MAEIEKARHVGPVVGVGAPIASLEPGFFSNRHQRVDEDECQSERRSIWRPCHQPERSERDDGRRVLRVARPSVEALRSKPACPAVGRRATERPEFRIEKRPALRARQGMWALIGEQGAVLKRGHDLAPVLAPVERRLLKIVAE